jgi:hypothetical protein
LEGRSQLQRLQPALAAGACRPGCAFARPFFNSFRKRVFVAVQLILFIAEV